MTCTIVHRHIHKQYFNYYIHNDHNIKIHLQFNKISIENESYKCSYVTKYSSFWNEGVYISIKHC